MFERSSTAGREFCMRLLFHDPLPREAACGRVRPRGPDPENAFYSLHLSTLYRSSLFHSDKGQMSGYPAFAAGKSLPRNKPRCEAVEHLNTFNAILWQRQHVRSSSEKPSRRSLQRVGSRKRARAQSHCDKWVTAATATQDTEQDVLASINLDYEEEVRPT